MIAEDRNNINFSWTQLKENSIFNRQKTSTTQHSYKQIANSVEESEEEDMPRRSKSSMPAKQRI